MNGFSQWCLGPGGQALAGTLFHSLWQAALLALVTWLAMRVVPARRSRLRYGLCLVALLLVVLGVLGTWAVVTRQPAPQSPPLATVAVERTRPATSHAMAPAIELPPLPAASAKLPEPAERALARLTPWLVAAWLGGVVVMTGRMIVLLVGVRRVARSSQPWEDATLLARLDQWRIRLGIARPIRVLASAALPSPAVLGLLRPTLVLPLAVVSGLPAVQLDAVLLHELAHIRRYDYLVNLVQLAVEALLFFNPAVWWLSRQIRIEREACCDAVAVRLTGDPADCAEALLAMLTRIRAATLPEPAAVPFAQRPVYSVLDRVRRILVPSHRPQLRLSWTSLAAVTVVGTLLFSGLWRGTELAVSVAAEILSPEQRMEALAQAQDAFKRSAETKPTPCVISGVIRTSDGSPLERPARMYVRICSPTLNSQGTGNEFSHDFRVEVPPGDVTLGFVAPGYASAETGLLVAKPGGRIENLEVVLERGFTGRLKLVDPDNRPLAGIELEGTVRVAGCGPTQHWTTDAEGTILLEHAGRLPFWLTVRAPGFAAEGKEIVMNRDEPVVWNLHKSAPATGIVLAPDGTPVANATLGLVVESGSRDLTQSGSYFRSIGWSTNWPEPGEPLAKTDAEGRYLLDCLRDDSVDTLVIDTPHDGRYLVDGFRPGQRDRKIRLQALLTVSGTVTGDLSLLANQGGQPVIHFDNRVTLERYGHLKSGDVPVRIEGGVGHFEIAGLYHGSVEISSGKAKLIRQLSESLDNVVLPLSNEGVPAGRRRVVLQLEVPAGQPQPQGSLQVRCGQERPELSQPVAVPLDRQGRAEVEALVGGPLQYNAQGLMGYWFPESQLKEVPAGDEPLVIPVPVVAAGAVSGTVLDADGQVMREGVELVFRSVEPSSQVREKWRLKGPGFLSGNSATTPAETSVPTEFRASQMVNPADGTFLIAPVPLGGSYVLIAGRLDTEYLTASEPVKLDEAQPILRLELRLPRGVTTTVQLVDPQGAPLPGARLDLEYAHSCGEGQGFLKFTCASRTFTTDAEGRVRLEHLNPELSGYQILFLPNRGYQGLAQLLDHPKDEEIVLRAERGVVAEGTVVDAAGNPVAGLLVWANPLKRRADEVYGLAAEEPTDAQGHFRFSTLAERLYKLECLGQQLTRKGQPAVIVGGSREAATIQAAPVTEAVLIPSLPAMPDAK